MHIEITCESNLIGEKTSFNFNKIKFKEMYYVCNMYSIRLTGNKKNSVLALNNYQK
jgi:hypothetical protein